MAIRYDPNRPKPWRVYYRNPFTGGQESQDYDTREQAEIENEKILERLKNDRDSFRPPILPEVQNRDFLTLEEAAMLYLKEKQPNRKRIVWLLGCWKICLEMYGNTLLKELTTEKMKLLRSAEMERDVSMTTIRCHLAMVRAMLNWCVESELLEVPIIFPKLPRAETPTFIPPSQEEMTRLIAVTPPHVQRVILLGFFLGSRVGPCELFRVRWSLVDFKGGVIKILSSKKNPSCPWRELPINSTLMLHMQEWYKADRKEKSGDYIIHYNNKPVNSIKTAWRTALKNAKIDRKLRPTDLRHAFASNLLRNGKDIGTVAQLMGHSSPTMLLKHYQHVCTPQKREAIESLGERREETHK